MRPSYFGYSRDARVRHVPDVRDALARRFGCCGSALEDSRFIRWSWRGAPIGRALRNQPRMSTIEEQKRKIADDAGEWIDRIDDSRWRNATEQWNER